MGKGCDMSKKSLLMSIVVAVLAVVLQGVAFAGDQRDTFVIGNIKSHVEVVVVTDWLCPSCRNVAPFIDLATKQLLKDKSARIAFVDMNVHPESANFSPYNLSFLAYEKKKYLELRQMLELLASRTKSPNANEVESAVSTLKVKYRPLNFSTTLEGMQYFARVVQTLNVHSTPTVVVRNTRTGRAVTLIGKDIAAGKIIPTVQSLQKG